MNVNKKKCICGHLNWNDRGLSIKWHYTKYNNEIEWLNSITIEGLWTMFGTQCIFYAISSSEKENDDYNHNITLTEILIIIVKCDNIFR